MTTIPLIVSPGRAGQHASWTRFSLPLPSGQWRGEVPVRIVRCDGAPVPVQTWPLAHWPDGSVRMLHAIANLPKGDYRAEIGIRGPAFSEVEIRGETRAYRQVAIDHGGDTLLFDAENLFSGRFGLELGVIWGDGAVGKMHLEGTAILRQSGPLYAKVERWAKVQSGERWLRFRLLFETFAGAQGMTIGVMLVNDLPGEEFQEIRAIEVTFKKDRAHPAVYQKAHGFECLRDRFVQPSRAAEIRADGTQFLPYIHNYEALEDDYEYPSHLRQIPAQVGNAVFLLNDDDGLQVEMEDFHLLRPKGIWLEGGAAIFKLWPEWAEPLRLPQGRRREVRFAVHWGQRGLPDQWSTAEEASGELLDLHRVQIPPEVYASCGFYDMGRVLVCRPDRYPRLEGWLDAASRIRTVSDFFDLGDTIDSHYLTGYIPAGLTKRVSNTADTPPRMSITSPRGAQCFEKLADFEPIWVNNEYDVLFALGTEFLRSVNLSLFSHLRWFARHTLEVDFVCYSDVPTRHRAQPAHCEGHTSGGAYPSHFWTQGLAQYYLLSGDEDALEVIRALADKTIWYFDHPELGGLHSGINREAGWAVLTLVAAHEVTGDAGYDRYARKIIDAVMGEPLPADLPDFQFGETSFMLGARAYLEVHGECEVTRPVLEWYLRFLDLAVRSASAPAQGTGGEMKFQLSYGAVRRDRGLANARLGRPGVFSGYAAADSLAYAYERTRDENYLRAGLRALEAFLDENPGYFERSISFRNPVPEGKPFAFVYRTWINYLGALDRVGWLKRFDYQKV